MSIDITDGVVRINAQYSVKLNRGDFQMEDFGTGVSVEFPVEDGNYETITDQAIMLEAELATKVKLAVFAQLGLEFEETSDGVLSPKMPTPPANDQAKPARNSGGRSGGRSKKSQSKSKGGDMSDLPRKSGDFDGEAVIFIDLRPRKASGQYAANAADFKIDGGRSLWLYDKDGEANDDVWDALEEAGFDLP